MAWEQPGFSISLPAEADLSALQHRFVDNTNALGQINTPGVTGDPCVGVLQDKPDAQGRHGKVMVSGVTKLQAGVALTPGLQVMAEATTGQALVATIGLHALGIVIEGAGDTEIAVVLLYGGNTTPHA